MADLNQLEARINRALARIEAALEEGPGADAELLAATREQAEEIAALRERIERLQEERRRDAEDVSAILADLKPLLES